MTREEAAYKLGDLALRLPNEVYDRYAEPLAMALEALKKQEPQRVIKPEYEYICECPSCGCSVLDCDYCKHCGQRLDWWDEEQRGKKNE